MISYEINLICVGTLCHPGCDRYIVSEPKATPSLKSFLRDARKRGWVVKHDGTKAFCPTCASERANSDVVAALRKLATKGRWRFRGISADAKALGCSRSTLYRLLSGEWKGRVPKLEAKYLALKRKSSKKEGK